METGYKVPERVVSMTTRFGNAGEYESVAAYMEANHFALTADLLTAGFKPSDIEKAVDSGKVKAAHWPAKDSKTDFYWATDAESQRVLEEMAGEATRLCHGQGPNDPVGGNFRTVGGEMGSQQRGLAALIYAREQDKVREIDVDLIGDGCQPLYVAKGGYSDQMIGALFTDQ
jgi:hypothetical protein